MIVTGTTRLGGLLGSPVAHSLSPRIHNDSFSILGLDHIYLCFDVKEDGLEDITKAFRRMNVYGFNLTMPDKQAVIPYLDHLSPEASLIGAVNTVSCTGGFLTGYNTDGYGYLKSVREEGIDLTGSEMVLMGCGGAARAIAATAALEGLCRLHLACRRSSSWPKAQLLVEQINQRTSCQADLTDLHDREAMEKILCSSILLTNATSAGMGKDNPVSPLPFPDLLRPDLCVSDIIYNPAKTRLLLDAEKKGCHTFNGHLMLLYQAEKAFEIWTGRQMPTDIIRERYF